MGAHWFQVTNRWIHDFVATPPAGWKAKQLKTIGVPWPPPNGWAKALDGSMITQEARRAFESFHRAKPPKAPKPPTLPLEAPKPSKAILMARRLQFARDRLNALEMASDEHALGLYQILADIDAVITYLENKGA